MLVAHVSDFHLFLERPAPTPVRADIVECVRRIVADMAAFRPRLDAVMLTGDLTDFATADEYRLIRALLEPLAMPVYAIPGNHDEREAFRVAFADILPLTAPLIDYAVDRDGIAVVALDTVVHGAVEGRVRPEQVEWLRERLREMGDRPVFLLMHHPPFETGIRAFDDIALIEGTDRLGALLGRLPSRLRILAGHVHRPVQTIWHGQYAAVAGSPAFEVRLDLGREPETITPVPGPYAYYIHKRMDDGSFTVHPRHVALPA